MTYVVGITLLIFIFLSIPIALSLGLASTAGILYIGDLTLQIMAQRIISGIGHFTLMALPFFIFAGYLMEQGGISKRLINMVSAFVGHRTGGVAIVTVLTAMLFSSISGSGSATTAALGSILIPAMMARGYSKGFASSVQAASGELGIIVPPSIAMVIYGVVTETSIGDLFLAGVIPGMILGLSMAILVSYLSRRKGYTGTEKADWSQRFKAFRQSFWALLMPLIILGGIYTGVFTPTESACVAVIYALIVGSFIYRELNWTSFKKAVVQSLMTSGMIMFIIACASIFSWLITREQIPQKFAALFAQISSEPYVFLLLCNIFLFIIGMFIDASPAITILAPILTPVAVSFGIDPVHFGVIIVVNMALGMITPPVGVNLFVAARIADIRMEQMLKNLIPFWLVIVVVVLIITYIPQLSLWLPNLNS